MHAVRLFIAVGLLQAPAIAIAQTNGLPGKPTLPRKSQVTQHARELLRKESGAKSEAARVSHALEMVRLARNIARDPRFETSPMLQRTRGWLVSRLRRVKKRLEADQRKNRQPANIEIPANVLAQLNAGGGPAGGAAGPPVAGGRGNPRDYGPLLVELIQETISPATWDVNGGPSTIYYYRPGRALVVRAPHSVHGDVAPLLGQIRR